jgi:nucleotide-binding universal stress UspA family protein
MGFSKLLCGTDLSEAGNEALRQADREARLHNAELAVVHVLPSTYPGSPMSPELLEQTLVQREALAAQVIDKILEQLAESSGRTADEVNIQVEDGPPAEVIVTVANDLGADLVVVGSSGASGLRRLFLGGVASKVVREAARPVLVARPSPASKRLVLGADFTPPSEKAARVAAEETRRRAASLTVIHSVEVLAPEVALGEPAAVPPVPFGAYPVEQMHETARQRLKTLVASLDVPGEIAVADGPPAQAIIAQAQQIDAELVVVGTAGRKGIDRLLLGSVAQAVVRDAPCSVLVIR